MTTPLDRRQFLKLGAASVGTSSVLYTQHQDDAPADKPHADKPHAEKPRENPAYKKAVKFGMIASEGSIMKKFIQKFFRAYRRRSGSGRDQVGSPRKRACPTPDGLPCGPVAHHLGRPLHGEEQRPAHG